MIDLMQAGQEKKCSGLQYNYQFKKKMQLNKDNKSTRIWQTVCLSLCPSVNLCLSLSLNLFHTQIHSITHILKTARYNLGESWTHTVLHWCCLGHVNLDKYYIVFIAFQHWLIATNTNIATVSGYWKSECFQKLWRRPIHHTAIPRMGY